MFASRFLWKLYAGYTLLIVFSTGVVGVLINRRIEADSRQEIEERLRSQAVVLADVLGNGFEPGRASEIEARTRRLAARISTRITVIRHDGVVIADSEVPPSSLDNHARRPEILAATPGLPGVAVRYSDSLEQNMMYVAVPVYGAGDLLGHVRTALPLTVIDERLSGLRTVVVLGAVLTALVALLLGFFFAQRITRPLLSMTTAAESIVEGRYQNKVPIHSGDELGKLAQAFNTMSETLESQLDTMTSDRNKLTAILASMVEGVIAVDENGAVVHMNVVAADIMAVDPEGSLSKPIAEVTPIEDIANVLKEAIVEAAPVDRVVRLDPESSDRILELHAAPLRGGQGSPKGAVLVLYDTTRLRRLERVRSDFIANVSHELKTPLTVIRGFVETLLDTPEVDEKTRTRFLGKVYQQCERLTTLVRDLLSLTHLESRDEERERELMDLRDVVRGVADSLRATCEAKGLDLRLEIPEKPVVIEGDEFLNVAVTNLVDNAIKYSPSGGGIWVRLRRHERTALLEVEDQGIGIEAQHHKRIFERFYRVDKARSRELGGTGLGLSIVKHTARALDGRVSVESIPGEGSLFRMQLPLTEPQTEAPPVAASSR